LGTTHDCINNGTIKGGTFVGGIVGVIQNHSEFMHHKNAGTIKSIYGGNEGRNTGTAIGGIVGHINTHSSMHSNVNIGIIDGRFFSFAGGIAGYVENTVCHNLMNSGMVEGGTFSVGGITGYLARSTSLNGCINTNRIFPRSATNYGAIVGENHGTIINCFYDSQMSIIGGINNLQIPGQAEGRLTNQMLGNSLLSLLGPG